jgi:rRNA maturation endonuclease Nob1
MKVLDASGIINLRAGELNGDYVTVEEIIGELRDIQARLKFENAVIDKKIKLDEPSEEAIEKVEEVADKNGVLSMLSIPDMKILALAYEKKIPIVTDDYDIQNMCWHMGLGFETIALPGIKEAISWKKKCTACGKTYNTDVLECEACGSNHFKVSRK